jgi:hypothetical protein
LEHHRSVPLEAEIFEVSKDASGGSRRLAWFIEIFHADEPLSPVLAGVEVAGGGGYERAEVKRTSR